jgi:hypothetical protein
MELGSLLLILALVILVVSYVARPLLEKREFDVTESSMRLSELQAEKEGVLMVLQELDMDHAMGKISQEDYQTQRSALIANGSAILKELDQLTGDMEGGPSEVSETEWTGQKDLEAAIEEEVRLRRGLSKSTGSGYCPRCGKVLQAGDRFCSGCGFEVSVQEGDM